MTTRKIIPRSGVQWVEVDCPVSVDGVDCARPVTVKVCVQTYCEGEPDGHMQIQTDYDIEEVTAPCGHVFAEAEEAEALYAATKQAVLDGED